MTDSHRSHIDLNIKVRMHETGHARGAGWADDTPIPIAGFACPKCMEVYSGDVNGRVYEPDETPEEVNLIVEWSIMSARTANDYSTGPTPRLAYSIEELGTVEYEEIPSRDG